MFRRRSQILWYSIGGFLLILAGVVAVAGITFPNALAILLVVAGVIMVAFGLMGFLPTLPALAVFLLGIVVLGLAASPYGLTPLTQTETHELTTAQATVEEARVTITVSTGSIKVSFTNNATLIYRMVFTKHFSIFSQPTVDFNYTVTNEVLTVTASSSTTSVDIVLNQNLESSFQLTTSTGSIRAEVPPTASKVEEMRLTASTGDVWVNMSSTAHLQNLVATTTTGKVEAHIKSSFQTRDATVQLRTTTGTVKLNLNITNIESDITGSTTTGKVNVDSISGFQVLPPETQTSIHARTPNYGLSPFKKLDVSMNTTTGNVDISAFHA